MQYLAGVTVIHFMASHTEGLCVTHFGFRCQVSEVRRQMTQNIGIEYKIKIALCQNTRGPVLKLLGQIATIGNNDRSGGIGRGLRGEEQDGTGDFRRLPKPTHGNLF